MTNILLSALYLSIPLVIAGILHMVVVRKSLFKALAIPIQKSWFGANKTWRGVFFMPVLTVIGMAIVQFIPTGPTLPVSLVIPNWIWLGLALGLVYILFELPNSYIKRRLNIPPGKRPKRFGVWFAFWDQADSPLGCVLVYALWLDEIPPTVLITTVILGPVLHLTINVSLYYFGLRKEPL